MITAQEIWPNFFIVGAQKSGTTSMYYYLKDVPGVFMCPVKEPNYFAPNAVKTVYLEVIRDKEEYLDLFRKADGSNAIGEASVSYLWDPDAPKLIYQTVPNAKIIILLRDPIERAFSQYLMRVKYGGTKLSFYDELIADYGKPEKTFGIPGLLVELGMYYEQVKRYYDQFDIEQIKVIMFEEFIKHPEKTVNEVLTFLGVSYNVNNLKRQYNPYAVPRTRLSLWAPAFLRWLRARNISVYKLKNLLPDSFVEWYGESFLFQKVQKPKMEDKAQEFLRELYHDDVVRLQTLLARPLPWSTVLGKNV